MSFIWLRWHSGTGHTERTIRAPILARVPFAFSWPLYYHLCRDLFALSNRTGTFPSQQTNKKESNPNQIQSKKERAWYYYYIHSEPIKIKTFSKPEETHKLLVWDGAGRGPVRSRGRRKRTRTPAVPTRSKKSLQNSIQPHSDELNTHTQEKPQLVTNNDASFPTVRKRGGAAAAAADEKKKQRNEKRKKEKNQVE